MGIPLNFHELKTAAFQSVPVWPGSPRPPSSFSDISAHLPVLEYYASLCDTVCEFGVRDGQSTLALLSGCRGTLHSFDIEWTPVVDRLKSISLPCCWTFHRVDTGSPFDAPLIPSCEMLFVDTLHTFAHVRQELKLHGRKASRFLAFHDTFTCGFRDESGPDPSQRGILPAIEEFLSMHSGQYKTVYRTDFCNGLWVLERFGVIQG